MARVSRMPHVRSASSGETRSPYTTRLARSVSHARAGWYASAAPAAASIDSSNNERSLPFGLRPKAASAIRYATTIRAVSPASETV